MSMHVAVVKDTSIQSAQAVVGSCPDMCPEKVLCAPKNNFLGLSVALGTIRERIPAEVQLF